MTTPAPPQTYPPGQPPPQQQPDAGLDDAALTLAIAAILAGTLTAGSTAASAAAAVALLKLRFKLTRAAWGALGAVLADVMQHPSPVTGVIGPASAQVSRMNAARRAQYVTAASKRVLTAARQARSRNQPVTAAVAAQLATEHRYYAQHQAAMWNRTAAAGHTDMAAATYGPLLGWLAVNDAKTSAECRAAHGKNFYATAMPDIGFPGSVHPHCRCQAVQPWPGGRLLPASNLRFARAA